MWEVVDCHTEVYKGKFMVVCIDDNGVETDFLELIFDYAAEAQELADELNGEEK